MTQEEQQEEFAKRLDQLVEYCRSEYSITYASVVGILIMKAIKLITDR